jgi:phosphoglycerol transferase MdoB-like AlkP superfamily enzyme
MKALADKGYYFKNYFSPATGTARSIYCTVTSLPDVELKGTSSRNPLIVNQHSIIEDFKGYEKFYFIGGSASWGNIRGMLNQSMDNLHLYEEEDYDSPRNDVWGISDADLAVEANKVLSKTKEPFFAIIQTAGNHRPYTIPDNAYDFKLRNDVDDKEVQKYGFDSLKEFNSFRFLDYSVGLFIERAKKEPYFKNTIFVFYGDHGISGFAGKHTRKYEGSNGMSLGELRVPFIIYSPLIKDPQTFDKVISETDVMPTIASLCGISYNATTIGRDVFDKQFDDKRYAFTIHHKSNPTIGVVDSKFYYKVYYDGSNPRLYDIYKDDGKNYVKEYPQIAKKMDDLTRGIFESARYIPYFNKREDAK